MPMIIPDPSEPPPEFITCPACLGQGEWETECCSGAGGCDCRGERVPMGSCKVCQGHGSIPKDTPPDQLKANLNAIKGLCFIGRGPVTGFWATTGTRGHLIK